MMPCGTGLRVCKDSTHNAPWHSKVTCSKYGMWFGTRPEWPDNDATFEINNALLMSAPMYINTLRLD